MPALSEGDRDRGAPLQALRPILGVVVVLLGVQLVLEVGLAWVFLRDRGPARGVESRRPAEPAATPKGERADQELDRMLKEFQDNLAEARRSLDETRERSLRERNHAIARLPVMLLFSIFFAMSATVAYVHLRRAMEGTEPQDMVSVFD